MELDFQQALTQPMPVEELVDTQKSLRGELAQIQRDAGDGNLPLSDEQRAQWAELTELDKKFTSRIKEQQLRLDTIRSLAEDPKHVDRVMMEVDRGTRTASSNTDIYRVDDIPPGERGVEKVHERAKRAVELAAFSHTERTAAQERATRLLDADDERGTIAYRFVTTAGPVYNRAFWKAISQKPLTNDEARALSLAGASGGFAIPFDLDPTIIPTSNGVVNPIREISRVVTTTVDTWRGVTSGAVVATYEAEATETTDNAPTLTQPEISTEKAQAFIPFSIEAGMDWPSLRAEMGTLLQDAKDTLEATKFLTGTGTNEPFGVITGATTTVNATAAGVFDLEDLYRLMQALPPRHQNSASFMGNLAILNTIRRFDTVGSSASIWVDNLQDALPARLLGKPAYEASGMAAVTTVGALFLIYGNFSRYVIVDRIGLEIELIPHLMGANRRPTGQRGLYAFWRNGAKVVDANAFRVLIGLA